MFQALTRSGLAVAGLRPCADETVRRHSRRPIARRGRKSLLPFFDRSDTDAGFGLRGDARRRAARGWLIAGYFEGRRMSQKAAGQSDAYNAKRRERWAQDPVYRAKGHARSRANYQAHR